MERVKRLDMCKLLNISARKLDRLAVASEVYRPATWTPDKHKRPNGHYLVPLQIDIINAFEAGLIDEVAAIARIKQAILMPVTPPRDRTPGRPVTA